MRCMIEETFGPTLPVMRVADAERGDRARQRRALRAAGLGVDPRHRARRGDRPADRGRRRAASTTRSSTTSALELPMGGWKASGLGSRHGADGIRKYTKRQSLMVTPGYAPAARAALLPLLGAQVTQMIGDTIAALATSELFDDAQRATLAAFCDTFIPSLEPPAGDEERERVLGCGPPRTWACRRRSRSPCCRRPRRRPGRGPARAARLARRRRDGGGDPAGGARGDRARVQRGEPRGAGGGRHPARPRRDALLRAARPRHRHATRTGTRSATRAAGAAAGRARSRSRSGARPAPRRRSRPTSASSARAPAAA